MHKRAAVATAVALGWAAAPAHGAGLVFYGNTDETGDATLALSSFPDSIAGLSAARCATGDACIPVSIKHIREGTGQVPVDDLTAGTEFEGAYTHDGAVVASVRTPAWLGRVANSAPPALTGNAVTGATVNPTPGTWSGGWDAPWGSRSFVSIVACSDARGTDCFGLSYGGPLTVEARWAGWYLFAAETRASMSNYPIASYAAPPVHAGALTRGAKLAVSAPLGPIDGAATPREQVRFNAGVPYVSIRSRATPRAGRLEIGRVSCAGRCSVELTVSGGGRPALHRTLTVPRTKVLTVPERRGRLTVRVVVGGKTVAHGTTRG